MKTAIIAAGFFGLACSVAVAQQSTDSRPAVGIGSKTMASCTMDERKLCGQTPPAVLKECLVRNWNHISSDCQDALATPVDHINPRR